MSRRRKQLALKFPRQPIVRAFLGDEVVADNFAGGGGASTGIEIALGRSPDIAVNHDAEAIAMHRANHPSTHHYCESVWEVDPIEACAGRACALAWFSPDCKHHSKAKGGKPRDQKLRGLAWSATRWAFAVRPRVIALENVEEFAKWGPLHKQHHAGCRPREVGDDVVCSRKDCRWGRPIKAREGETFHAFVRKLEGYGYEVQWRILRACDYGAPTKRRRLFLVARCDGWPIAWPQPTHGNLPGLAPYRTAAECIDWSIDCPSIFDGDGIRKNAQGKELVETTLRRIVRGVAEQVMGERRPFIVPVRHGGVGRDDRRVHSVAEPMPTVTSHGRGGHAVVAPYLVHRGNGERPGQAPRIYDIEEPLGTVVAQGEKHALCAANLVKLRGTSDAHVAASSGALEEPLPTISAQGEHHGLQVAYLAKHYGGHESKAGGTSLHDPIDTITARDHHSLVAGVLVRYNGERRPGEAREVNFDEPLPTTTTANRFGLAAGMLVRYNGEEDRSRDSLEAPLGTLTTRDRFAVGQTELARPLTEDQIAGARRVAAFLRERGVEFDGEFATVEVDGEEWIIVDIGMRMLAPRELFRAQGFSDEYEIAPTFKGKPLSRTAQVRMCGNSVCPPAAAAVIRALELQPTAVAA